MRPGKALQVLKTPYNGGRIRTHEAMKNFYRMVPEGSRHFVTKKEPAGPRPGLANGILRKERSSWGVKVMGPRFLPAPSYIRPYLACLSRTYHDSMQASRKNKCGQASGQNQGPKQVSFKWEGNMDRTSSPISQSTAKPTENYLKPS